MYLPDGRMMTHHGCFKDNAQRSPFSTNHGRPANVLECAKAAALAGRWFFGVEYGGECYGADGRLQAAIVGRPESQAECNSAVDPVTKLQTGASDLFNLYEMDEALRASLAAPETRKMSSGQAVLHHGCFVDNNTRKPFAGDHGRPGSVLGCAKAAALTNRRFFGIEAGGECRSSDGWNQAASLGRSKHLGECNSQPLDGFPSGGGERFNLYEMDEALRANLAAPETRTMSSGHAVLHHGCFVDNSTRKPFAGDHGRPGSVIECAKAAALANRRFFGIEAGGECRSSDGWNQAISLGRSIHLGECNAQPLDGFPSGGGERFNLYEMSEAVRAELSAPTAIGLNGGGSVLHHGCFKDDSTRRPFQGDHGTVNEARVCAKATALLGRRFFGLEAGGECRSSNDLNSAAILGRAANLGECNRRLVNFPAGGGERFNLYEMDEWTRATLAQPETKPIANGIVVTHHGCFHTTLFLKSRTPRVLRATYRVSLQLFPSGICTGSIGGNTLS